MSTRRDQLWVSPVTGYPRRGTSFSDLRKIFIDNVTVKIIYEHLYCCLADSRAEHIKNTLKSKSFDIAGAKETESGEVIGYVVTDELKNGKIRNYIKTIEPGLLISDSTPLCDIFSALTNRNFVFILHGKNVRGIVTKADINKLPVRIYLFGVISLFEMRLNQWIEHFYPNDSWKNAISDCKRIKDARDIYEKRKESNQDISLLECLQFCDKRDLLEKSGDFISKLDISIRKFNIFVKRAEKIRNKLAHSHNSIISNIEWPVFIETIRCVEKFLKKSDAQLLKVEIISEDS